MTVIDFSVVKGTGGNVVVLLTFGKMLVLKMLPPCMLQGMNGTDV